MFVVFADTWQSYVVTYCTNLVLKEMSIKEGTTQTSF